LGRRAPAPGRPAARATPKSRGVCDGELRRVLGVEPHVLLAQITGPDAVLAAPQPQIDRDVVFPTLHDLLNPLRTYTFLLHPPLEQELIDAGDGHLILLDPRRALADRHHGP